MSTSDNPNERGDADQLGNTMSDIERDVANAVRAASEKAKAAAADAKNSLADRRRDRLNRDDSDDGARGRAQGDPPFDD